MYRTAAVAPPTRPISKVGSGEPRSNPMVLPPPEMTATARRSVRAATRPAESLAAFCGLPQPGHVLAAAEISRPQSPHLIIFAIPVASIVAAGQPRKHPNYATTPPKCPLITAFGRIMPHVDLLRPALQLVAPGGSRPRQGRSGTSWPRASGLQAGQVSRSRTPQPGCVARERGALRRFLLDPASPRRLTAGGLIV